MAYLEALVREHGGYLHVVNDGYWRVVVVALDHHPCPPHRFGWSIAVRTDAIAPPGIDKEAFFLAGAYLKLASTIQVELVAHVGNPDDPENCQCVECYRDRLRAMRG